MKKIIVTLVVLLLTAPAWADVTITSTDLGDGVVEIGYVTTGTLVRAFALDITITDGNIVDVNDQINADYDIYPGSIVIDSAGEITDAGSAVCDATYPETLDGLDSNGVTIEMGSLYEAGVDPAPAASGVLLTLTVNADCTLTVVENAIRGGIVLEDVTSPTVLTLPPPLVVPVLPPVCVGDVDGSSAVNKADIVALVNYLINNASPPFWTVPDTNPAYSAAADIDSGGAVNKADIVLLVNYLINNASAPFWSVPCP